MIEDVYSIIAEPVSGTQGVERSVSKPFPEEEYKRWLELREKHDELSISHKIAGERFNFEAATKFFDEAEEIAVEMKKIYDGIMAC